MLARASPRTMLQRFSAGRDQRHQVRERDFDDEILALQPGDAIPELGFRADGRATHVRGCLDHHAGDARQLTVALVPSDHPRIVQRDFRQTFDPGVAARVGDRGSVVTHDTQEPVPHHRRDDAAHFGGLAVEGRLGAAA